MFHYRKNLTAYESLLKPEHCPFCDYDAVKSLVIRETKYAYVLPNRVSYDMWEMRNVTEHLMVIPKKHVLGLAELPEAAMLDIIKLIAEYEAKGYNVYARAVDSAQRSQPHQHTHLIKLDSKPGRFVLFLSKPYFLLKF
ncbi:MAG: hypothetical protein JWM81_1050 [Candidatus Saccharibacteria bacterium]|nr:hypothetical protein [Candidatus Saccharibacteria bacterium]